MTNPTKSKRKTAANRHGFLHRLRHDVAGNALFVVAAATVPLVGLIGAGIDVSRTYLVKARLQQACDAGVLAGRKFMTTNTLDPTSSTQAQNYFKSNFPTGIFGSTPAVFTVTANESGMVSGAATSSVPTTVMAAFKNGAVPLAVTCKADLKAANTDVMFVLDVSGSMAWCPNGNASCNSDGNSRIAGLRSAVVSFYDALTANALPTARNRFGFVNYANTVNVGGLLPASSLVDSWNYQSRVANMTTPVYEFGFFTGFTITGYRFTNWTYKPVTINVANYKTGSNITFANSQPTGKVPTAGSYDLISLAAISSAGTTNTVANWSSKRCIEERDTVAQATFPSIPSTAYDLDIDTLPTSQATKWRPAFNEFMYNRNSQGEETTTADYGSLLQFCVPASTKLAVMSRSQVQTYVNGLVASGGTYHDIGMIWGARLMSPTGIFASENATAPNGSPINRHIVFMTDGEMSPNNYLYTPYGYERADNRVAPFGTSDGSLVPRHNERFVAMCRAARARNITVWTVAFGTGLTQQLTDCADPGKALAASDSATLNQHFRTIAARISDLRLTQ